MQVSVATYNIHRSVGSDRRYDPHRIVDVIGEVKAEILGLQEVDGRVLRHRPGDQFEFYRAHLPGHVLRGPVLHGPKGAMATALVSVYPIVAHRRLDLGGSKASRGAIDVDLDVRGEILRVVVAHLGLRAATRRRQVELLCAALDSFPDRRVVVMGDFNEWYLHRPTLMPLDQRLGAATPVPSFPARFPILSLDRIWAGGGGGAVVGDVAVHRSLLARRASDHLPVRAEIRWR